MSISPHWIWSLFPNYISTILMNLYQTITFLSILVTIWDILKLMIKSRNGLGHRKICVSLTIQHSSHKMNNRKPITHAACCCRHHIIPVAFWVHYRLSCLKQKKNHPLYMEQVSDYIEFNKKMPARQSHITLEETGF